MAQGRVIVVGGGIGGLAAALALACKGLDSHVLEQAPQFGEIGAGIQLGPNVFKMFARLGLTEAVSRIAWFPDRLVMMDCITAQEVTRITLSQAFLDHYKFPYALIHRADLHGAILDACRRSGRVTLETSRQVTGVTEHEGGVTVALADGSTVEGAAVIGADGLWSTVRGLIADDGKPRVSGHIAYRAVLASTEVPERLRLGSMVIWAGEKTHLVHYPLRNGEITNLVAVFHSNRYEEGWDSYGDPAELRERFAGTCAEVRTMLGKIEEWRMWVLCDREPIKNWSRGRDDAAGRCRAPDAAIPGAGRGHGDGGRGLPRRHGGRARRRFRRRLPRLSGGALSAHRAGADHGARLWRDLSRRRRGARSPQPVARRAHAPARYGRHGLALRRPRFRLSRRRSHFNRRRHCEERSDEASSRRLAIASLALAMMAGFSP